MIQCASQNTRIATRRHPPYQHEMVVLGTRPYQTRIVWLGGDQGTTEGFLKRIDVCKRSQSNSVTRDVIERLSVTLVLDFCYIPSKTRSLPHQITAAFGVCLCAERSEAVKSWDNGHHCRFSHGITATIVVSLDCVCSLSIYCGKRGCEVMR